MINSIVERNRFTSPITETERKILQSAIRLFLENGYSQTTIRAISADCGLRQGTIAYHFHAKEDMLYYLIQALTEFHGGIIDNGLEQSKDVLFSYAAEISIQIALCETNRKAWDLYYSAYSQFKTFEFIKNWAAKEHNMLFAERLPDWKESDFFEKEHITSGIELAVFYAPCDRFFTLEKKISLTLDSLMLLYNVSEEERKQTIEKILKLDCVKIGQEMFEKFVSRIL
ncbi:MAG: helix-turn-helix transcriptional regulator [Clostridia bacterium]|nr:helix-turn-helix transcriptional regulator [Clostridia bacterium]